MVEVTSHSINPPTEDTLADIKTIINSRIPLLVGGKVPVDISTSVGSMNVNAFPAANLGQQPIANSLSVAPASDIADSTYIGDIRFGEALPVGDNVIGKVKIDQNIPGTTNLVNVNGGASQTDDIKVTLDSETIAVAGPLTDAQLTAQLLAKDSSLTTINSKLPALSDSKIPIVNAFKTENLGQQPKANSLSIAPASDIADATYIGDVKFGEKLPTGDNVIGKVGIDQTIPGTTNRVSVEGIASQATAIKVSMATLPDTSASDLSNIKTAASGINGKLPTLSGGKVPVIITNVEKSEDAVHTSGDVGVMPLAVRKDIAAALAGSDGDYAPLEVDNLGRLHTLCHQADHLSSSNDSVDVPKMSKGARITAANLGLDAVDVTTTSGEISMIGHNYITVFITVAGAFNWTVKLQGAANAGGTFMDLYDGANPCSVQLQNMSRVIMWPCGAPYAKIVATEDADGTTCTVEVVPFNR